MIVHEFQKNAWEKVIIKFTEFMGSDLIDIRVYRYFDENNPTYKGISISRALIPELKRGIDLAFKEWEKNKATRL